nr:cobalt-precorrin 5A hydrolase [Desulfobulbaceae bacterium]
MRVVVLAITNGGKNLSQRLCQQLPFTIVEIGTGGLKAAVRSIWNQYDGIIFIMATGIVVRTIAPLLRDKNTDPAIVVIDERGHFAISLLAGHIGGGNALAQETAEALQATAVITTASDVLGLTAIDLWARHNKLTASKKVLTQLSSLLVNNGKLFVASDFPGELPPDFIPVLDRQAHTPELNIAHKKDAENANVLTLHPQTLVVGIGCNRNTPCSEIESAVKSTCEQNGLEFQAINCLASIDLKSDEVGLLEFANSYNIPIFFHSAKELNTIKNINPSKAVYAATGAYGVAEPAALLSAQSTNLIVEKTKWKNVTVAISAKATNLSEKYL